MLLTAYVTHGFPSPAWQRSQNNQNMVTPPIFDNKRPPLFRCSRHRRCCAKRADRRDCPLSRCRAYVYSTRTAISSAGFAKPAKPSLSQAGPATTPNSTRSALGGQEVGIVGRAVGAPFAVLVAEELFASGCRLLVSLTSAGQIAPAGQPPYFVVIDRALRDEGTSYHYAPPSEFCRGGARLGDGGERGSGATEACEASSGPSWTTDAPFRETAEAIEAARRKGILAVEMEAAALYAFAKARAKSVLCLAHVTNAMGQNGDDFEKGEQDGAADALRLLAAIIRRLAPT